MKYAIPAIIFAGGKSSRMGKDKALLPFGKASSLSAFQHARLNDIFSEVYLSAKEDKFDFECNVIHDRYDVHSPLAALVSIFETLDAKRVFILSVDAPFVDKEVIALLMKNDDEICDAVVAKTPRGVEPLCALYKRTALDAARRQLEEGNHRLTSLLDAIYTKEALFEDETPFLNLNRPEEYERALTLLV